MSKNKPHEKLKNVETGPEPSGENCYRVRYPSGKTFTARGQFRLSTLDYMILPTIEIDGKVVVLDQRAIVTLGGREIYNPRRIADGMHDDLREWLRDHPEWGNEQN